MWSKWAIDLVNTVSKNLEKLTAKIPGSLAKLIQQLFATMVWSLPVVIWISVPGTCSNFRHHGLITSCCDLDLGARWDFSNLPTTNPYVLISVMINFFQRQNPLVVCIDQGSNTLSLINIKLVLGCFYIQVYSWLWIHYLVNKLSIPHAPIFYLSSITA